jgi:hypothetical protein
MNDMGSVVNRMKYQRPWAAMNYGVLTELNTQPRTSYLERIRNPSSDTDDHSGTVSSREKP